MELRDAIIQMQNAGDAVQSLTWQSLAVAKGIYGSDDFCQEIAEIKFEKPVPIKVNNFFQAIRN